MINLTIKTLDSADHPITIDDEATVYQLKEKIREEMGFEIGLQRLIFCGRVLQDNMKLSNIGVNGKVVHLVERVPPAVLAREALRDRQRQRQREAQNPSTSQSTANVTTIPTVGPLHLHHLAPQNIRRLMNMAASAHGIEVEDEPGLNLSPTASRLEYLRRLIEEIREQVEAIRDNENALRARLYYAGKRECARRRGLPRLTLAFRQIAPKIDFCAFKVSAHKPLRYLYQVPPNYPTEDPPQPSGLIAEAMRDSANAELEPPSGTTRQSRGRSIRSMQRAYHTPTSDFADLVSQLHQLEAEFAPYREMYITTLREASDTSIGLSEQTLQRRQLTAEISAEVFHSLSHAYHIVSDIGLLMTHGNSRLTSESLLRQPLPVQAHISLIQSSVTRRPLNSGASTSGQSSSVVQAQPGAAQSGRNQPTVNVNVQPDPITYQVEIETRVPLPVNPDNQSQNQNQNPSQTQTQNQSQNRNVNQDEQANRRQVMLDFENLIRGLSQSGAIGGVEVVMSMEQMVPAGAAPAMPQVLEGTPHQVFGPQILVTQMPWGGQPTADFLQNVVSSVIRQGVVPGMENVIHVDHPNMNQASTSQNQDQTQAQTSIQTVTTQSQPSGSRAQDGQASGSSVSQAPQESSNGGQASTSTTSERPGILTISINNLVYDRFLACDSTHARRQLERRRDATASAGGPRLRDNSTTRVQNIVETLFERFDRNTINQETLIIAAFVTLRESTAFSRGRTLVPEELLVLRLRLQVHMRGIMQGEYEVGSQVHLTDLLFERHATFINRMPAITPLRPSIDEIVSMRNVFESFLNEAMIVLFLENNEICCRRFRVVFPRLFYELCGVISYFCLEGVEGLRRIYRSFVADLIQNIDEPVRDLLYSLALENLNTAITRIQANRLHSSRYLRKRENAPSTSTTSEEAASMEIADGLQQSEPMQDSPLSIADSTELEAEYNINTCSTPTLQEAEYTEVVPTVNSLLNENLPSSSSGSSAPTVPAEPIVSTVATISANTSSYQAPTIQSVPIASTSSMVPSAPVVSSVPIVPVTTIVPTVSAVSGVTDLARSTPVTPSPTIVTVTMPASTTVRATPVVPLPAAPTVTLSPIILSPYSPLSPENDSTHDSSSSDDGISTSPFGDLDGDENVRIPFITRLTHQRNLQLLELFPDTPSGQTTIPLSVLVYDEVDWNDEGDDPGNRLVYTRFSASEAEPAPPGSNRRFNTPLAAAAARAADYFNLQPERNNTSAPSTSTRPGPSHDSRQTTSAPSTSTRPGPSHDSRQTTSAPSTSTRPGPSHDSRQTTSAPSTSTRPGPSHDSRQTTSAPSTSTRPGPSHDSRQTVTSRSTSPFINRSNDNHRGNRGRRHHRGSNMPSTSTSPYTNRSNDNHRGNRGRRHHRGSNMPSTSTSPYTNRSNDNHRGNRGRRHRRGSNMPSTSTSPYTNRSNDNHRGNRGRRHHRGSNMPSTSTSPYTNRSNDNHRGNRGRRHHRGSNHPGPSRGVHTGVGHGYVHSNPMAATLPARAERPLIGNSYGSISYSSDVQYRQPAPRANGLVRQQTRGRGRARSNQRNNPVSPPSEPLPSPSPDDPSNVRFVSPPSPDDPSNMRFVPPAHIAQHWGEDWVPTFTRDIQQQNDSSEPHSDAYLSGMPPKKRRCVRQSRPPATLDGLISESLSVVAPQEPPTLALRAAFRQHLRVLIRARAAASADYDPTRYVNTERFLKQKRPPNKDKATPGTSGSSK